MRHAHAVRLHGVALAIVELPYVWVVKVGHLRAAARLGCWVMSSRGGCCVGCAPAPPVALPLLPPSGRSSSSRPGRLACREAASLPAERLQGFAQQVHQGSTQGDACAPHLLLAAHCGRRAVALSPKLLVISENLRRSALEGEDCEGGSREGGWQRAPVSEGGRQCAGVTEARFVGGIAEVSARPRASRGSRGGT